ncbi:hypothetical protein SLA2020_100900 [Shorea laevis]
MLKMEGGGSRIVVSIISVFLAFLACASSYPALQNFLQCLPINSNPSHPISGAIYIPRNSSFESVLRAYTRNLRFTTLETPKPLAIITALHESHVQATVICAKSHGLQIRIRSGGHDYEGLSYVSKVPFVILDMFNLRSIDIDIAKETAWVQTGASLGELYYKIATTSKVHAFPAGVCLTVGTGGHFSGGGYGVMMRKYGLSVDNIIDAQIVNVNGRVLNRVSMGEDLFWAIRGGGGASFGVILSWKIKLVRIPPKVTMFNVPITSRQGATDVVYRWQEVAPKLPGDLFIRATISNANGIITATFRGLFLGQTDALLQLTNQSFPELNLTQKDCKEMSWLNSTLLWYEYPEGTSYEIFYNRTLTQGPENFYKGKSDYVKKVIPKESLEHIWKLVIKAGITFMQWNPYGGRMSEIPESETPFPHRAGNLFKIQYGMTWGLDNVTNARIEAIRELYSAMTPYVSSEPREAFLNYRDLDIGKRSGFSKKKDLKEGGIYGVKYFKGNLRRLTKVKAVVDPDNFFVNEQSIPPSLY